MNQRNSSTHLVGRGSERGKAERETRQLVSREDCRVSPPPLAESEPQPTKNVTGTHLKGGPPRSRRIPPLAGDACSLLRTIFAIAIVCIFISLVSCGGGATSDETRSPGEIAFRRNCQTCHSLPKPSLKSDEEWPPTVARYAPRAKLTPEDIAAITAYLVSANGG
jgi:hypothetical protein